MAYKLSDATQENVGITSVSITHFQIMGAIVSIKVPVPAIFRDIMNACETVLGAVFVDFFYAPDCAGCISSPVK
jgi:hypothetical protein